MGEEIKKREKKTLEQKTSGTENKKKFGLGEFILVTLILFFAELFDFLMNIAFPIPVVGQVLSALGSLFSFVVGAFFQLYLFLKGASGLKTWTTSIAGWLANSVPLLQIFPLQILAWFVVVAIENNPKLEKVASVASGKPGAVAKK
ncbi:MAG: hypothetical protein WC897_06300 [Candidatus Gracilibacteria bacterium]